MLLSAVFFVSVSTLAFEVLLTRVFSIGQWNHLSFMVISIALFGFGASGTFLCIVENRKKTRRRQITSRACGRRARRVLASGGDQRRAGRRATAPRSQVRHRFGPFSFQREIFARIGELIAPVRGFSAATAAMRRPGEHLGRKVAG